MLQVSALLQAAQFNVINVNVVSWGNSAVGSLPLSQGQTVSTGTNPVTLATGQNVASVTGAVGSVTGNVGGNVVGSVGSVSGTTGAAASVAGNVGGNVNGVVNLNTLEATALGAAAALNNGSGQVVLAAAQTFNNTGQTTPVVLDSTSRSQLANLDTNVGSRLAASAYTAPPSAGTIAAAVQSNTANVNLVEINGSGVGSVILNTALIGAQATQLASAAALNNGSNQVTIAPGTSTGNTTIDVTVKES